MRVISSLPAAVSWSGLLARACSIIATQSLESLVSRLRNEHVTAQLLANLRTKIWLCAEDNYTARQAADLCGEIEREKVSRGRNETGRAAFSFLDGKILSAERHQLGASTTVSPRREHLFPPRAFTSLRINQAIVKAFDGVRVLEPCVVYLKPMHEDPELSWFDTTGRVGIQAPTATEPRRRFRRTKLAFDAIRGALHRGRIHGPHAAAPRTPTPSERREDCQEEGDCNQRTGP